MSVDVSNTNGTSPNSSNLLVDETKNYANRDSVIQSEALVTFVDEHESDDELCTGECDDVFATDAYFKHGKHTRMNDARKKAGKKGVFEHHTNLHSVFDLAISAVKKKAAGNQQATAALAVYESKTAYDRKNPDVGRSWLRQLPVLKPICARHKKGFLDLLGFVESLINEHKLVNSHNKIISVLLDLKRDFKAAVQPANTTPSNTNRNSSRRKSKNSKTAREQVDSQMKKYQADKQKDAKKEKNKKQEELNKSFKDKLEVCARNVFVQMDPLMDRQTFSAEQKKSVRDVILPMIIRRFFTGSAVLDKEDAEYQGVWETVQTILGSRKSVLVNFCKQYFDKVNLSPTKYLYEAACDEAWREAETKLQDMNLMYIKSSIAQYVEAERLRKMQQRHAEEKAVLVKKLRAYNKRVAEETENAQNYTRRQAESYRIAGKQYQDCLRQMRDDMGQGFVDPLANPDDYPTGFGQPPNGPPPNGPPPGGGGGPPPGDGDGRPPAEQPSYEDEMPEDDEAAAAAGGAAAGSGGGGGMPRNMRPRRLFAMGGDDVPDLEHLPDLGPKRSVGHIDAPSQNRGAAKFRAMNLIKMSDIDGEIEDYLDDV
jgi:hypothetical protein